MAWISRLRALFRRDKLARELDEELAFHLSMREQWNVEQGMPRAEAHHDARRRFGNPSVWRERMSEIDLMILPQTILQDLRYGARTLFRNAGFTTVAILALAIGIGVNTTAFTFYKAMFTRSLDARDPGQNGQYLAGSTIRRYRIRLQLSRLPGISKQSAFLQRRDRPQRGASDPLWRRRRPCAALPLARCWEDWDCCRPAPSMQSSPPQPRSPKTISRFSESRPCAAAPSMR